MYVFDADRTYRTVGGRRSAVSSRYFMVGVLAGATRRVRRKRDNEHGPRMLRAAHLEDAERKSVTFAIWKRCDALRCEGKRAPILGGLASSRDIFMKYYGPYTQYIGMWYI